MAVTKALLVMFFVLAACDVPGHRRADALLHDAPYPDGEPYVDPDAAPPPFDAAPPSELACHGKDIAMTCALPPSQCLDANYLIYYTGGECVNQRCQFETHWLYCYSGCVLWGQPAQGGYCEGGFT